MGDPRDQLQADLAERYAIERELGRGGMATAEPAGLRRDRLVSAVVPNLPGNASAHWRASHLTP